MDGLSETNSNVRKRAIVIHGASYATPSTIRQTGRLGRSQGCFAVDTAVFKEVIDMLKGGSLITAIGKPNA